MKKIIIGMLTLISWQSFAVECTISDKLTKKVLAKVTKFQEGVSFVHNNQFVEVAIIEVDEEGLKYMLNATFDHVQVDFFAPALPLSANLMSGKEQEHWIYVSCVERTDKILKSIH